MGYEYVVSSYTKDGDKYRYEEIWTGDTLEEALKVMEQENELGIRCIRLVWRSVK